MIFVTGPLFAGKKAYISQALGLSAQDLAERAVWDVQDLAAEADNLEELRRWFVGKTRDICEHLVSGKKRESENLVEQVKTYIDRNFQKDLSLDEVSRMVNISPYYFSKLFKQGTGENFIEYLTRVRMEHARRLLEDPDASIKQVCVMSGYGDPNYFSRLFKKYEGVTPSEYRERFLNG